VKNLPGVVQVTFGDAFTCALLNPGDVQCWGLSNDGELGGATTTGSGVAVVVQGL
jgi:alpha-tubulin suppressor-like RCC1 family protein